jgi:hypothetical protein
MAYSFNGGSQSLTTTSNAGVTGTPMTLAAWIYPTNTVTSVAIALGKSAGSDRYTLVYYAAGFEVRAQVNGNGSGAANAGTQTTANSWRHMAAVFTSTTSRQAFYNGVGGTVDTALITTGTIDSIVIGARYATTLGAYFPGRIAECGVWNTDLTAAEIASLADGMTCDKVRPQSLVFYAPLVRDLQDVRGGLTITNNNTATVANHPRVYA